MASMDWAKQLQDETRNIQVWEFGASYIRGLTVVRWHQMAMLYLIGLIRKAYFYTYDASGVMYSREKDTVDVQITISTTVD